MNQLKTKSASSSLATSNGVNNNLGGVPFGATRTKLRKYTHLLSKICRRKSKVSASQSIPQAPDFGIDHDVLIYDDLLPTNGTQVISHENIDTASPLLIVSEVQTSSLPGMDLSSTKQENSESSSFASTDPSQTFNISLTEISQEKSSQLNIMISNEIDQETSTCINSSGSDIKENTESEGIVTMEQLPEETISEEKLKDPFTEFKREFHAIYEVSTNNDVLAMNLFKYFTQFFDEECYKNLNLFIAAIIYWINHNQEFNINEDVWRKCAFENDEILFTIGEFLNIKTNNNDPSNIEPVLLLLSMIANYKIVACGYQLTHALILLSKIGNESVIAIIYDIFSKAIPPIDIPLDTTRELEFVSFGPQVSAQDAYLGIVESVLQDAHFDEMAAAVKLVSHLSKTPIEYMSRGQDLFAQAIKSCFYHAVSRGCKTIKPSYWLAAALECPRIYNCFANYFECKTFDCDHSSLPQVLQMFKYMRSHIIFSTEFGVVPAILNLHRQRRRDNLTDDIFIKILTQEEISYSLTMEIISTKANEVISMPGCPVVDDTDSEKITNRVDNKKSVSWNSNIVACPITPYKIAKRIKMWITREPEFKTFLPPQVSTTDNDNNSDTDDNTDNFPYRYTLASRELQKKVKKINAAEGSSIRRQKRHEKWVNYKWLLYYIKLTIKHMISAKSETRAEKEEQLSFDGDYSFHERGLDFANAGLKAERGS